ncbi:MAG: tetratricopeptide repeat protein [Alphaproteobacteria bacterium]
MSYERSDEWPKAEADFDRALSLEPNQPDVLNYLAYSWLTMGKNVDKARDYLEIALSARPGDAHIIDSMGWAEYLAGDYPKAVDYFEKAVDTMPDDPTVNDHLGDAYWRAGRQVEARYQWQRALADKPDEPGDEQAIEEKLKKRPPRHGAAEPSRAGAEPAGRARRSAVDAGAIILHRTGNNR